MYKVNILRQAMRDIAGLPRRYPRMVGQHIDALARDPRPHGSKKLETGLGYSVRVGVYRIIYDIDDQA